MLISEFDSRPEGLGNIFAFNGLPDRWAMIKLSRT